MGVGVVKLNPKSSFLLRLLSKQSVMKAACALESERPGFETHLWNLVAVGLWESSTTCLKVFPHPLRSNPEF